MSSEAERKTYLNEHLGYEMFMLRYTAQTLPQRHQQLDWNICVESFAVHARVLYEFLTNDTSSQNFRARDYVRDFKAPKTNDTKGIFDRVHRQVLHLAKNRSSEAAGKIILADVEKAKQWIEDHFKIFIGSLEEPYRSCWDEHAATPPQNGLSPCSLLRGSHPLRAASRSAFLLRAAPLLSVRAHFDFHCLSHSVTRVRTALKVMMPMMRVRQRMNSRDAGSSEDARRDRHV
jgi:hypothetical protein